MQTHSGTLFGCSGPCCSWFPFSPASFLPCLVVYFLLNGCLFAAKATYAVIRKLSSCILFKLGYLHFRSCQYAKRQGFSSMQLFEHKEFIFFVLSKCTYLTVVPLNRLYECTTQSYFGVYAHTIIFPFIVELSHRLVYRSIDNICYIHQ